MAGEMARSADPREAHGIPLDCHPKVERLFAYWRRIHPAGGGLPGRQHLDPRDIPDLLDSVALIDVVHDPRRFRLRLVGTQIVEFRGRDCTGQWMDEAFPDFPGTESYQEYVDVIETGAPRWSLGRPSVSRDRRVGTRERILLPLASDGRSVDMLLVLLLYKLEE